MAEGNAATQVLRIKKYPNRRYYDTTRSCHVTLQEVHDLILSGRDVVITDSRSGTDITNLILIQILLEKDQPKLDIFPTSIFHMMIRSDRRSLRTISDRFFGPFMDFFAASRDQFDEYLRRVGGGAPSTLFDWADGFMEAFSPFTKQPERREPAAEDPPADDPGWDGAEEMAVDPPRSQAETLEDLRRQIADLTDRIEGLEPDQQPGNETSGSTPR